MRIEKHVRIWEAASQDKGRPLLNFVSFDAKAGTLTATNSYIAARVPCEVEDGDESGLIPAEALKEAKGRSLRVADGYATLEANGGDRRWRLGTGVFPDVDEILSRADEISSPVGINPWLAGRLGDALGTYDRNGGAPLVLHPIHPLKPMRVTTARGGLGILMPVRIVDAPHHPLAPDLSDDAKVVEAARAAVAVMQRRRGKKRAAQAFREALLGGQAA